MFVFGGIMALLMYLQSHGIIDVNIHVDKIQSSLEALIDTIAVHYTRACNVYLSFYDHPKISVDLAATSSSS
jgi:hypothetical protein